MNPEGGGGTKRKQSAPMFVGLLLLSSSLSLPPPSTLNTTPNPNPPRPPTPSTPRRTLAPPTECPRPFVHEAERALPAIAPATYALLRTLAGSLLVIRRGHFCGLAVTENGEGKAEMLRGDWAATEPRLINPSMLVVSRLPVVNPSKAG